MRARSSSPSLLGRIAVCAWLACAIAVTVLVLRERGDWSDLAIYRWGGAHAFDSGDLYALVHPTAGLQFTYPPFAAALFAAAGAAKLLLPATWTVLSFVALARTSVLLARARGTLFPTWPTTWAALFIGASILITEPASGTLLLGQIGFVLLWLVCEGLLVDRRAASGVLIGLAVAIKLTPGMFVLLLASVGRWRTLTVSALTVLATIALGWVLLPTESRTFWTGTGADAARVGAPEYAPNQSINGMIWRLTGPGGNDALWLVLAALAALATLWLARRWWLADARAGAIGLAGLGSLLASPVSWTHHWLLAAPLLVGLLGTTRTRHRTLVRIGTVLCGAVLTARVTWRVPNLNGAEFDHTPLQVLAASAYPLVAVVLIVLAWLAQPQLDATDIVAEPGPVSTGAQRD